ncbi:hypothetical protein A6280_11960 [Bacillus wiedmannii]|nr:hypothetical protein A6280_11960 [Bacillus wiedmannii]OUB83129.1 hypothetical protein BK788_18485 [Bacillus thuringiensis serovar sinensis]
MTKQKPLTQDYIYYFQVYVKMNRNIFAYSHLDWMGFKSFRSDSCLYRKFYCYLLHYMVYDDVILEAKNREIKPSIKVKKYVCFCTISGMVVPLMVFTILLFHK